MKRLITMGAAAMLLLLTVNAHAVQSNKTVITKYLYDPMNYFVSEGDGMAYGGVKNVADLPPLPLEVQEVSSDGNYLIDCQGEKIWLSPVDVKTSEIKKAVNSSLSVGNPESLQTFGSQGIGEK